MVLSKLTELGKFFRLKICLFLSSISVGSHQIFHPVTCSSFSVFFSSFFLLAGIYSYNNMHDKEEDMVNREKINYWVKHEESYVLVTLFFSTGFLSTLTLPTNISIYYLSGTIGGVIYSYFKLKKYILVKNFYTSLGGGMLSLLGIPPTNWELAKFFTIYTFSIFLASIISDLRDYEGDKAADIETLPVRIGYHSARRISIISVASFLIIVTIVPEVRILSPYSGIMLFFLLRDQPRYAHTIEGISFINLAVWIGWS